MYTIPLRRAGERRRSSLASCLQALAAFVVALLCACDGDSPETSEKSPPASGSRQRALSGIETIGADPNAPGAIGNFYIGHTSSAIESAETPISLAFLNDHVAGSRGHLHNVGGKLFAGNERIRLYGVTMFSGALMPDYADAIKVAARLRKEGFNAVRLFGWDKELKQPDTWTITYQWQGLLNADQTLNDVALDYFDHFVYQLEQAGIYVMIPLHGSRKYKEAPDCIDFCQGLDTYLPLLIQSHKDLSATLLNHVNPYTGKAYKDDPAVVAVEVNNEDSLSHRWSKGTIDSYLADPVLFPKYGAPLEVLWRDWVRAKYATPADAGAAYAQALTSFDDLKAPLKADLAQLNAQLVKDWLQFAGETDAGYLTDMVDYLKSTVGVKSMVMGTQTAYTPLYGRIGDIAAHHTYHGDVGTPTGVLNVASGGAPVLQVENRSLLSWADPKDTSYFGLFERKDLDKPNFLTEHAARMGNQYMAEAEPVVSAYAGFQDLDAIFLTDAHSMNQYAHTSYFTGFYNVSVSAVARTVAALSFRRGDVTPGQPMVLKKTKQHYLDATATWNQFNLVNFHFGGNVRAPFTQNMYQQIVADTADENVVPGGAGTNNVYTTSTGQMVWKGLDRITLNTPRTKTAVGYFSQASIDMGSGFEVVVGTTMNNYAVVQITSLTDSALPSSKMLLSLTGYFTVPNEYPRLPGQRTYSQGTAEPRIEAVPATVRIPTIKTLVVSALDRTGAKVQDVPVVQNGLYAEFVTGPAYDSGWYLIEEAVVVPPPNNPPTVTLTAPSTATVGAAEALSATAEDSDGTIAKVEFFDNGALIDSSTSAPFGVSWTASSAGTHTLIARATDNAGAATDSTAIDVTVAPANVAPTVSLTAPANATVGTAVTLGATAADSDGSVTTVEFFDNGTLVGTDTSSPYSVSWTPTATGARTLKARATDNLGAASESSINVTVAAANLAPTVSLTAPSSGNVGTPVTLAANAADSDGTIVKVEFFDNGTSLIGTVASAPYSLSWTPTTTGTHRLTARATDNSGATTASAEVLVNVATANAAPTVSLSAPSTATLGKAVTLSASASDSDGSIARVEFYDAQTLLGSDTSNPYKLSWTPQASGVHSLTARATDNRGATTTSLVVSVTVPAVNAAPTVTLTAPATAIVGTAVALSASAADSDGSITKVDFFDGSTAIGTATAAPYGIGWTASTTGLHTLTARATDNSGATTTSSAVSVEVSAPQGSGGLQANYFASPDLSGAPAITRIEPVSFVWSGSATPGAGIPADQWSVRWTGSIKFSVAGNYKLQVTADDGIRVWVNGQQVVNRWSSGNVTTFAVNPISASAGMTVPIKIEHFDASGDSTVKLGWKTPGSSAYVDVPAAQLVPD